MPVVFLRFDTTFQLGCTQLTSLAFAIPFSQFSKLKRVVSQLHSRLTDLDVLAQGVFFFKSNINHHVGRALVDVAFAVRFACISGTSNTWNF